MFPSETSDRSEIREYAAMQHYGFNGNPPTVKSSWVVTAIILFGISGACLLGFNIYPEKADPAEDHSWMLLWAFIIIGWLGTIAMACAFQQRIETYLNPPPNSKP